MQATQGSNQQMWHRLAMEAYIKAWRTAEKSQLAATASLQTAHAMNMQRAGYRSHDSFCILSPPYTKQLSCEQLLLATFGTFDVVGN